MPSFLFKHDVISTLADLLHLIDFPKRKGLNLTNSIVTITIFFNKTIWNCKLLYILFKFLILMTET